MDGARQLRSEYFYHECFNAQPRYGYHSSLVDWQGGLFDGRVRVLRG